MKKIFLLLSIFSPLFVDAMDFKGRVVGTDNQPVSEAVITADGCKAVRTDEDGTFLLEGVEDGVAINVYRDGFYRKVIFFSPALSEKVVLLETDVRSLTAVTTGDEIVPLTGNSGSISRKDFPLGEVEVEKALAGGISGLQVVNKSGMTGEGAYLALRGIHTFHGDNAPLVVINGMPYIPDNNESQIIGGYSRSLFQALNNQDIRNITVLKGADAAIYGSMGSNGVIVVETDAASKENMNTKISFNAMYGCNWNSKRLPMMENADYKSYLSDMGLTYYSNMEAFFSDFSFLTDVNANHAELYQYNTDWQDEIMRNATTMDYLFRVEGGDAVAKYNISLGYSRNDGTVKNTFSDRYSSQINTSIMVSKQFEINANINLAYLNGKYQEQGLSYETNPLLAAVRKAPLLSPYASDLNGNLINKYSSYNFGAITNSDFIVSNPLALVESMNGKARQYNMNAKVQLNYTPLPNLTFSGAVGMFYNYNQEQIFIPGINNSDIVYLFDQYGQADNSVRVGTNHTFNMFYNLSGQYDLKFSRASQLLLAAGFQAYTTSYEYDAGVGRNTANDFYQTLSDVQSIGRYFTGYNNKWNWADFYAHAQYSWRNLFSVGANLSLDRASSTGSEATKWYLHPSASASVSLDQLMPQVDAINKLNIFADYSMTGNSRYSSKLAKYYYTSTPYQDIAGIIRGNIPNVNLKPETTHTLNVGLQTSFFNNRVMIDFGYYNIKSSDVLLQSNSSAVFGTGDYYDNLAKLTSKGIELSAIFTPIVTRSWRWSLGGNITTLKNRVESLGGNKPVITTLTNNDYLITAVGHNPYEYYGYQTLGVFSTVAEATAANLTDADGRSYSAGDVHFVDQNNDGIIDANDRTYLGSATPDFYGNIFTRLQYKHWAIDANLTYSHGGKIYNAMRRVTESGLDFSNQAISLNRRWSMEGQVTDIPRVSYGDQMGNNAFSDRWIEDGSYLKLHTITLSYEMTKSLWNFIQGFTVYATAENLVTFTKYLGLDPEFSYSYSPALQGIDYGKATAPRSVKFGINLRF